jgi:hypothetical protein
MTGVTESDRKLITELQTVLDQLDTVRHNLYTRRPGCQCDEKTLCALHAAVYNYVFDAGVKISLAIGQAEAEG